jgi:hypothetical protein
MAKKKALRKKRPAVAEAAAKPTIEGLQPDTTIYLQGKTYHLFFDYAALALAEEKLIEAKRPVNMVLQLDMRGVGATRLPILFFASLVAKQPAITFEEASALISVRTALPVHNAVYDAYLAAMAEPSKEKEPHPTEEPVPA